jgi:hypothetical protein
MLRLAQIIKLKIILTVVLWCLPSLFFPIDIFDILGFPVPSSIVFVRLLGVAYLALLTGYSLGLRKLKHGGDIVDVVWVGIVSNGLVSILLFVFGFLGEWISWGVLAQTYMWGSALVTGLITIGLIITGLFK